MTGRELRHVPHPPIGPHLDLFEVIPGLPERKIRDDEEVRIHDGLQFVARREVTFHIRIDRAEYEVHKEIMTGLELRHIPNPPIGPDRDLFEVVPGGSDRKIGNHEEVRIHDGLRFFTAPAQINPGRVLR
jgi:Multiubiquitin